MRRLLLTSLGLLFFLCGHPTLAAWFAQEQNIAAQSSGVKTSTEKLTTIASRKQALADLELERDRLRKTGDQAALIQTINQIAELHLKLFDSEAALADVNESLPLARKSNDTRLLVDTLIVAARVNRSRQKYDEAITLLTEARQSSRQYREGDAHCLMESGIAYSEKYDYQNAEKFNDEALLVWRELQDERGEALTLRNQGETYMLQDKGDQAAAALERSISLWRKLDEPVELATTLVDVNFLAIREGQWQKALDFLTEARVLVTDKDAEPFLSAQIAMSLGEAYEAYGQFERALDSYNESLVFYRDKARVILGEIDSTNKAGRVQAILGNYLAAAEQIQEGLKLAERIRDTLRIGLGHEDLGRVWLAAGSYQKARTEFQAAIAHFEQIRNRRPWARARMLLAQTDHLLGNLASAAVSYREALHVFQNIRDHTNEAAICFGLGKLELKRRNLEEAGTLLKRSIFLTEQLRQNAVSKDLRSSFLASVRDRYEIYVEWLMHLHSRQPDKQFDIAAFEASEMARARSLLESLKESRTNIREGVDSALLEQERRVEHDLSRKAERRAELLTAGKKDEAQLLTLEINQLTVKHDDVAAQIKLKSPRYAALTQPQPLTLREIQHRVLDDDSVLLEYLLGDEKSYLWAITRTEISSYELPARARIESAAGNFLKLLTAYQPLIGETFDQREARIADANTRIPEESDTLSKLLLGAVHNKLGTKRLVIVPDGALQYIPFQALTVPATANSASKMAGLSDGEQIPLIFDHEIVYEPSASALALVLNDNAQRNPAPNSIAVFANPVFEADDPRVKSNGGISSSTHDSLDTTKVREAFRDVGIGNGRIPALPASGEEAEAIMALVPRGTGLKSIGFDASRTTVSKPELAQFRIVHFATHGIVDYRHPQLSGLVLSLVDPNGQPQDGFLRLHDIYNLRLSAHLVVLSACNTGLGQEVKGEGLIGLTRGFMYAGATGVAASLWKVDDEATAELMKYFYEGMFKRGLTPSAAMRDAQLMMWRNKRWHAPYYWAAFVIQGQYDQKVNAGLTSPTRPGPVVALVALGIVLLISVFFLLRRRRRIL